MAPAGRGFGRTQVVTGNDIDATEPFDVAIAPDGTAVVVYDLPNADETKLSSRG